MRKKMIIVSLLCLLLVAVFALSACDQLKELGLGNVGKSGNAGSKGDGNGSSGEPQGPVEEEITLEVYAADMHACLIANGLSEAEATLYIDGMIEAYSADIEIHIYTRTEAGKAAVYYTTGSVEGAEMEEKTMDEIAGGILAMVERSRKNTTLSNAATLASQINLFEADGDTVSQTLKEYIEIKLPTVTVVWSGEAQNATQNTIASASGTATVTYEGYACVVTISNGNAVAAREATKTTPSDGKSNADPVDITVDEFFADMTAYVNANARTADDRASLQLAIDGFRAEVGPFLEKIVRTTATGEAATYTFHFTADAQFGSSTITSTLFEMLQTYGFGKDPETECGNRAKDLATIINMFALNAASSTQTLKEYIAQEKPKLTINWSGEAQNATQDTIASASGTATVKYEGYSCVVTITNGYAVFAQEVTKD